MCFVVYVSGAQIRLWAPRLWTPKNAKANAKVNVYGVARDRMTKD